MQEGAKVKVEGDCIIINYAQGTAWIDTGRYPEVITNELIDIVCLNLEKNAERRPRK